MDTALQQTFKELTSHLSKHNYHFICPSPESHARVIHRYSSAAEGGQAYAENLEQFFGWNLPIREYVCDASKF
jgi:hypothetical protein